MSSGRQYCDTVTQRRWQVVGVAKGEIGNRRQIVRFTVAVLLYLCTRYEVRCERFPHPPSTSTTKQANISLKSCLKMPSTAFQPILDAALADYAKQIGTDPVKHPFVDHLRSCHSPDDVLKILEDKANEFKDFRDGNRKLIDCLNPVVKVVHMFSGILGEASSFVSRIPRSSSSRFH